MFLSVLRCWCSLPVQVVLFEVVVAEDAEELDVLTEEAGRQQAVDPQLQTLLQRERHALKPIPNSSSCVKTTRFTHTLLSLTSPDITAILHLTLAT